MGRLGAGGCEVHERDEVVVTAALMGVLVLRPVAGGCRYRLVGYVYVDGLMKNRWEDAALCRDIIATPIKTVEIC